MKLQIDAQMAYSTGVCQASCSSTGKKITWVSVNMNHLHCSVIYNLQSSEVAQRQ